MRVKDTVALGRAVRATRQQRGLTQGQLALQAHVSREWITRLEKGSARLEIGLVLQTLDGLGIELQAPDPITADDQNVADQVVWTMGLEGQNLTPDAQERLVRHIASRRSESKA